MKVIDTGLYSKLSGASALTTKLGGAYIYNQHAPAGQSRPYVIFQYAGGGLENINPSGLINEVYIIKGVADSLEGAADIAAILKTTLHGQTITVSGYTNFHTQHEEEVSYAELPDDGQPIYHAGAMYRFRLDD